MPAPNIQSFTGTFASDPIHSTVGFSVRHMGVSVFSASFDEVTASFVAEDGDARLEGSAVVESVTIKRNPPQFRDHVIGSPEFFDGGNHPEIAFRSTSLALDGAGGAQLEGELTIKGIARPVTATGTYTEPVEDLQGNTRFGLTLAAAVDRRDWEMSWQAPLPKGGDVLGWDVDLTVNLALVRYAG